MCCCCIYIPPVNATFMIKVKEFRFKTKQKFFLKIIKH